MDTLFMVVYVDNSSWKSVTISIHVQEVFTEINVISMDLKSHKFPMAPVEIST